MKVPFRDPMLVAFMSTVHPQGRDEFDEFLATEMARIDARFPGSTPLRGVGVA